nr:YiiX/YebB-like N1pC/P60 family cysteine hydrolase [Comamonas testosteroni]
MIFRKRGRGFSISGLFLAWLGSAALAEPALPAAAQAGDLIFRKGTEGVSQMVMGVDQGLYSHVGMLVGRKGRWQVLHATPSEKPGQADGVVLDSLDFFLAPQRSQAFAVYHVQEGSAAQRQSAVQWALAQQGRGFEIVNASKGIYCTTLVWQAWTLAGLDWPVSLTEVTLPLLKGQYLLPSALQKSQRIRHIQ